MGVDLTDPDMEIRVILAQNKCYVGVKKACIPRRDYENRKVQHRPFFSPISLHPRLARALVNLARVKRHSVVLDPFCGTGGILIEAGLIGARVRGSDVDPRMIAGCKANLEYFGIENYDLFQADIGDLPSHEETWHDVDTIITDPPYGRSTSTVGEPIDSLYGRAFEAFRDILKEGSYLAIALPSSASVKLGRGYLKLKEVYQFPVHRSLTRFFCVFTKPY
jgi:tRNA (guanine10-N2)-dimethyltransferase